MHGIIHSQLKKFVVENYDADTWKTLMKKAKLNHKYYLVGEAYPDQDAFSIVAVASEMTGLTPNQILEAFGKFIVPTLIKLYGSLIKPEWRTLDLLLNTEETIHRVVRMKNPGAHPPRLKFEEVAPGKLRFTYTSERKMEAVAVGIMHGVAEHFEQKIKVKTVEETKEKTIMEVRLVG